MATINLRPWREELRAERQKQFVMTLVFVAIIAAAAVYLWQSQVVDQITYQESRNRHLEDAITILDKKSKEIEELKEKRQQLIDRMKIIQDLQGTRPVIVHVFEELVNTLPDGLYYQSLTKKGDEITIEGIAESNNRIATLMRNFEESKWFDQPNLADVSALQEDDEDSFNKFILTIKQVTPSASKENEKDAKASRNKRKKENRVAAHFPQGGSVQ